MNLRAGFAVLVLIGICAVAVGGCSDSRSSSAAPSPPATATTAAGSIDAHAAAAGRQAARAYARSQGLPAAADAGAAPKTPPPSTGDAGGGSGFRELDWLALMPSEDLEALKHPPPVRHDGSQRMRQFGTFSTVAAVTGKPVKLPGYVVPIANDESGRTNEFFFVPFFGACIHVPPPPPNQIIHVRLKTAIETPQAWDPFWLRGTLTVELTQNRVAGSAYEMSDASLVPYDG